MVEKLFIVALEQEMEGLDIKVSPSIPIVFSGLGKINATKSTLKSIYQYKPKLIINYGSVGSKKVTQGSLVVSKVFFQRDMDLRPLGFELGETAFDDTPTYLDFSHVESCMDLPLCSCGTGDSFVNHQNYVTDIVDMESYAIAKVCFEEKIDFIAYKYVSDSTNQSSKKDWNQNKSDGKKSFLNIYNQYLGDIKD